MTISPMGHASETPRKVNNNAFVHCTKSPRPQMVASKVHGDAIVIGISVDTCAEWHILTFYLISYRRTSPQHQGCPTSMTYIYSILGWKLMFSGGKSKTHIIPKSYNK